MTLIEELRLKQSRDNRALLDRAADRIETLEKEKAGIFTEVKRVLLEQYTELNERRLRIKDPDALDGIDGEITGLDIAIWLIEDLEKKYTEDKI